MDDTVFAATLRNKLKQKIKKSTTKGTDGNITVARTDDQVLDRRVTQVLQANQSSHDKPTAEQCIQFFCSDNNHLSDESESPNDAVKSPDVTRLFVKRFEAGIGKYQQQSTVDQTTESLLVTRTHTTETADDANPATATSESSFLMKPVVWPMDLIDQNSRKYDEPQNKMCKQTSVRDMSVINSEIGNQLSIPLLKSADLQSDILDQITDANDEQTTRLKEVLHLMKKRKDTRVPGDSLQFCSLDHVLSQPRFKMLQMRSAGLPHLTHLPVPLNEREVPLHLLQTSEAKESDLKNDTPDVSGRKEKAVQIRDAVQQKLLYSCQCRGQRMLTLQDLVHEEETTVIDFAFSFLAVKEDRRPLRPTRKERKKRLTASTDNISITVTLLHASHLPVRTEVVDENESRRRQSLSGLEALQQSISSSNQVCAFVEAVFQRQAVRTTTAEGTNATWNQTLELSLKPPNDDTSPASLSKIKDNLILNLYDEIVIYDKKTLAEDDDADQIVPPPQLERRWLGSLTIPFTTLYLNSRIEGTFAVKSPLALMGYEFESAGTSGRKSVISRRTESLEYNSILLTIFVTINPPLQKLQEVDLVCNSDEDENLIIYARAFEAEFVKRFPDRRFKSLVVSMDCKWVLVTRYLSAIRPPEVFHDSLVLEEVMHRIARYVSLIPSEAEFSSTGVVKDIWLTCDQFMDLGIGDQEEHAILLCNYFLYLGRRAGLVVGSGIPEGMTSYVITYEYSQDDISVWNCCTGQKFRVTDSFVPLNTVAAIITTDNVYANIQPHTHPNRVNFDLSKTNLWSPLFGRKADKLFPFLNLATIQPEKLVYPIVDASEIKKLQEKLERHVKSCLMRWRPKAATFFNRSTSLKLRKFLSKLEKQSQSTKDQTIDMKSELHDILSLYRVTGFPLQMPFTDMESVTEAVFATSVHVTDDAKVEFAVAVHLTSYPGRVISLSLYVAALHLISNH